MARTRPTLTTRLTPKYGTSSGTNPGEDFESPEDLSDIVGLDAEIPRGNARPSRGLLQPKPKPRSPLGLEAGKSAGGGLGIVLSVPLGGPISGRGGINLGEGGSIEGGSLGLGLGLGPLGASIDVGTDQDEEGRGGCYQYITVTLGPFSHTYGKNVCEPKPLPGELLPSLPTPTPLGSNDSAPPEPTPATSFPVGSCVYNQNKFWGKTMRNGTLHEDFYHETPEPTPTNFYAIKVTAGQRHITPKGDNLTLIYYTGTNTSNVTRVWGTISELEASSANQKSYLFNHGNYFPTGQYSITLLTEFIYVRMQPTWSWEWQSTRTVRMLPWNCDGSPPSISNPLSPPISNPPPRKKMDDCCKKVLPLLGEVLRLLGRQVGPEGLKPMTGAAGLLGESIKRIETPITDGKRPKEIEIKFDSIYAMLVYALKQANNLDTALDPQSYKIPSGYIPNPDYSRDSEHSLKDNSQPDRDKNGNDRELEINENDKAKMGGFLQQQEYIFNAIKRLEYLFPLGELSDAVIAKDLLIPGGEGDIKIHNMIMAYEIQMMYLNATFGNPREVLTIKDANPAIEGDQPIEITALTLSDWFRQVVKFQVDTGGDVDAAVNLMLRDFRTNLANRTDIIKTAEMTQALFEDSGMREQQQYIEVHLEGDPYAGQWVKGQGFQANPDLEKKTEEATEKVLRETMKPTEIKLKVSRRHKEEKTDMRDLLRGLADFVQRLLSIPSAGDAGTAIDKLIESAKFKVQTEAALLRANVVKAATASRNRTKKRKK